MKVFYSIAKDTVKVVTNTLQPKGVEDEEWVSNIKQFEVYGDEEQTKKIGTLVYDEVIFFKKNNGGRKMYLVTSDAFLTFNESAKDFHIPSSLKLVWKNIASASLKLEGPNFVSNVEKIQDTVTNRKVGFVNAIDEPSYIKIGQKVLITNFTFSGKAYKKLTLKFGSSCL